ncbi:hypothetical protein G5C51_41585 [Streptomyces sp. A7024]|uniref:Lipoprotein n=1 Tax=Streptomyces coryli TaxID=1128680 RepID=A0A6G4UDX4_9ACTN|nr:hypothetical protein [Streptomyces coryli]NGN70363.1 hypothetical protein [Streptomyces coryli]
MTQTKHMIRMSAAGAISALALFTAACSAGGSGDSGDSGDAAADKKRTDAADQAKRFDCLRKKGVDIKEPKSKGDTMGIAAGGLSQKQLQEAMKACGMDMGGPGGGKELSQADKDKALAFAQCMRDAGLDYEDPEFEGGAMKAQRVPEGDQEKFKAAGDKCQKKIYES